MNREDIVVFLKENLRPKRVAHSLGTEQAARALARRFGCDEAKAALAGLAHDCAKGMRLEQMVAYAGEVDFPLDEVSLNSPQILHAPAGAALARQVLGIADEEVLGAICWHTVPRFGMTMLEKIVSVADLIEENRDYDGVEDIRRAARGDLDEALRLKLGRSAIHVLSHGLPLHAGTIAVYNDLCLKKGVDPVIE